MYELANHWAYPQVSHFNDFIFLSLISAIKNTKPTKAIPQKKKSSVPFSSRQGRMFRKIWESTSDAIGVTDSEGILIYANQAYFDLYKYKKEEMLGKSFSLIFPPEFREEAQLEYKKFFRKEKITNPIRTSIQRSDGVIKYVGATYSFIYKQKKRVAMVSIIRDITSLTIQERKKEALLRVARHELKNPLTSIKGYVDLIDRHGGYRRNQKINEYLDQVHGNIDRMSTLIDELFDISGFPEAEVPYDFLRFDFDTLVKDSVREIQTTTNKHKILVKGETKKTIIADKTKLGNVITNLLINAVQYSPNANEIVVRLESDEAFVKAAVTDYGKGIPENRLSKIFNRYYRRDDAARKSEGKGIGLQKSREIIYYHGGRMNMVSEVGKGSTFVFTIPINS